MSDVITLSELSDEPGELPTVGGTWPDFSPRLRAVMKRLPSEEVRILNGLRNAGVWTLADLLARTRSDLRRVNNLGPKSLEYIDDALAKFGLARADAAPPIVVRDGASVLEAHAQLLLEWAAQRILACGAEEDRVGIAGAAHAITEREVLVDVMLILDGREPLNKRAWGGG